MEQMTQISVEAKINSNNLMRLEFKIWNHIFKTLPNIMINKKTHLFHLKLKLRHGNVDPNTPTYIYRYK